MKKLFILMASLLAAANAQAQVVETRNYGEATTVDFALFDTLGANLKTDAVDGGLDCSIIKDEGTETACTNDFVDEGSTYSIALTAAEMSASRIIVCIVDADSPDVYLPKCMKILTTNIAAGVWTFPNRALSGRLD